MSWTRLLSPGLLLLPLLLACGPEPGSQGIHLVHDPCDRVAVAPLPPVSPDQLGSVEEAMAWWNLEAGTRLALASEGVPLHFEAAAPFVHGLYDDEAGVLYINRDLEDPWARTVVIAHELGHLMGLEHVPPEAGPSLMNPGNTRHGLQPADLDRLRALWGTCPTSAS